MIVILIIGVFVVGMTYAAAKVVSLTSSLSFKQILISFVSSPIEQDEQEHTNFLLLGMGGGDHDGAELTDTIIVASIDHESDLVAMLSIPRDLYIEDETIGNWRVNRYYELTKLNYEDEGYDEEDAQTKSLEDTTEKVAEVLDIDIHYYALVDFSGFIDIVDAIGGIDIYLEENFYDPYYPIDGTDQYQTFYLPAGENHLDGEDALKYARSRKTTSDFDRALRQQEIIAAIKDKAFSLGVLANPSKLKKLYDAFFDNFESNLSFTEIAHLGGMAEDFSSDSMISQVFSDDPYVTGGFLYTPDRTLYGGAAVLIPSAEDYSEMQLFTQLFLYNPEIYLENTSLQVLNGSKYEGLATDTKTYLTRYGLNVARYGNAARVDRETTSIYQLTDEEFKTLDAVSTLIPTAEVIEEIPEDYWPESWVTEAKIIIELGTDFIEFYEENYEERFYYWQYVPVTEEEPGTVDETAEAAGELRDSIGEPTE